MEEPPQWRSTLYGILPHPDEPRILLLPTTDGWALPQTQLAENVSSPAAAQPLFAALERELGVVAPVLRCALVTEDEAAHDAQIVLVLENPQPAWTPPAGARWVDRTLLAELALARPEQRAVLAECLDELLGTPVPEQRPPWARSGWFAAATRWIEDEAARLGYPVTGPIEYVRTWSISAVLRAPTAAGALFFKQAARLPLFADEPALTAALAGHYPLHLPVPLAIDRARGWMLLPDIGYARRDMHDSVPYEAAARIWAELQRASSASVAQLFAAGCLDRSLDVLAAQIDPLLEGLEPDAELSADDIAELRRLAPEIKALCGQLARYRIPPALVHGDLHWGNIALKDPGAIFFDLTDACVAHPFLDLTTLLNISDKLPEHAAVRERLRASYLAPWADYAPPAQLQAAAALGQLLGAFHQAVSYQYILAGVEPASRSELASGLGYFLGQGLRMLRTQRDQTQPPAGLAEPN